MIFQYICMAFTVIAYSVLVYLLITEKRNSKNNKSINKTSKKLISADKMYNQSIIPQMQYIIEQIEETKDRGDNWVYLSHKLIAHENIDVLLAQKYDIHITYYDFESHGFSYEISFGKHTTGKLTFENTKTKEKMKYKNARKDNRDIIQTHKI